MDTSDMSHACSQYLHLMCPGCDGCVCHLVPGPLLPNACPGCDPANPGGHLPPPGIDFGDGRMAAAGGPETLLAVADWLNRHYPDGPADPQTGPVTGPTLNMGIRLITEVMDHAPGTLTPRERNVLLVLAEDALDEQPGELEEKRVIRQPIGSPQILRRARVSRPELYTVLRALIVKGCLDRITTGGRNHPAKYRIPPLAPQVLCLENADAEPVSVSGKT